MPPDSVDPTQNVQRLVDAAIAHMSLAMQAEHARQNEITARLDGRISDERQRCDDLRRAGEKRGDDLRQADNEQRLAVRGVDVESVKVASQKADATATVLASQVDKSAETLRQLVAATAAASSTQIAQQLAQVTERIGTLERVQSESRGTGKGMQDMGGWIFGGVMTVLGVAAAIYAALHGAG